ncbi:probable leucine-rich repeat receptor-like protein kinase At1g68400 [Syzygium oleosum]|uniref:probable leucine-rich repeat receptor-like protein kinase At1g68400 n=1 Tax=Syzygium oleosum TaxID=219896 RepID=UPI0024BBDCD9|nr:probable leucine-rich repeat receptor-like protein kinase At1g68400 [Syzygium oleosum]
MNLASNALLGLASLILVAQFSSITLRVHGVYYAYERDDLVRLRDYLKSPTFNLRANWSGPPCINNSSRWVGVSCLNSHVVHLVLDELQLTGSLPPGFLENVTFLSRLSFRDNSISGPLPNLTNLVSLQDVLLSGNRFSGPIPPDYVDLPRLKNLELHENNLSGRIPPFGQLTLIGFNISYNRLEGPIPQTRVLQEFPRSSYDHNPGLCGRPLETPCAVAPPPYIPPIPTPAPGPFIPPPARLTRGLRAWIITVIAAAAVLVPLITVVVFMFYCKMGFGRKEQAREDQGVRGSVEMMERSRRHLKSREDPERTVELDIFNREIQAFDLDDLLRASAEVLGRGKLGSTYKTILESGSIVAVKRLNNMNGLRKKEFKQQMHMLGNLMHENLVRVISFYYSKEEKLVVYEFVSDGNLFKLLHENRGPGRVPLAWDTRLSIIKDIAKGLSFLHQSLSYQKVPHANLKSSNVLISRSNQNFCAKLADFGFFSLLSPRKSLENLAIGRTPELSQGKKLTHKADIYCFGIIILELMTGRIPGETTDDNQVIASDISEWVKETVHGEWSTDVLDVEIYAAKEGHDDMLKLTEIALECTDLVPERRPEASELLRRIEEIETGNQDNN